MTISAEYKMNEEQVKIEYEPPNFYRKPSSKELAACRSCRLCLIIFFVITLIGLLAASITLIIITEKCNNRLKKDTNSNETEPSSLAYQVFVKSFYDSNNDGVGDLNGLTKKLTYIQEMGVNTIILNDVVNDLDFGIDQNIGSMEDFQNFTTACKLNNISVFLQLNPVTVSSNSEWFKDSANVSNSRFDWFIWSNTSNNRTVNKSLHYNKDHKKYYYSPYGLNQPALNYLNDDVLRNIQKKLIYWLKQEVKGFLMVDVSKITSNASVGRDLQTSHAVMRELYDTVHKEGGILWVLPRSQSSPITYLGSASNKEADRVVNDDLAKITSPLVANDIKENIDKFIQSTPKINGIAWILGGVQYHRAATRMSEKEVSVLNLFMLMLPQKVALYYGDELSLKDDMSNKSSVLMQWKNEDKEDTRNKRLNSTMNASINGLRNLTQVRNKLTAKFNKQPQTFLQNDVIGLEYDKDVAVFVNFGAQVVTVNTWNGTVESGIVQYCLSKKVGSLLKLKPNFVIEPYDVIVMQVKKHTA